MKLLLRLGVTVESAIWMPSFVLMLCATCTAWTQFPAEQQFPGPWNAGRKES